MKPTVTKRSHRGQKTGRGTVVSQKDISRGFTDLAAGAVDHPAIGVVVVTDNAHGLQGRHGVPGIFAGQRPEELRGPLSQGCGNQCPLGQAFGTGDLDRGINGFDRCNGYHDVSIQ